MRRLSRMRASPRPKQDERHREGEGEEAGPVDLGRHRVQDPVESVAGESDARDREQELWYPVEPAGRSLGLVLLDEPFRPGGERVFEPYAFVRAFAYAIPGAFLGHRLVLSLFPSHAA